MHQPDLIASSVLSGIVATTFMTLFMYLSSVITRKQLRVIHILGTMVTGQTTVNKKVSRKSTVLMIGTVLHYLVGIGFAYIYIRLFSKEINGSILQKNFIYGFSIGTIAIVVWWIFFRLHPNPPDIPIKPYLVFIFVGHLIFALVMGILLYLK